MSGGLRVHEARQVIAAASLARGAASAVPRLFPLSRPDGRGLRARVFVSRDHHDRHIETTLQPAAPLSDWEMKAVPRPSSRPSFSLFALNGHAA